jgi:hypothetical protein
MAGVLELAELKLCDFEHFITGTDSLQSAGRAEEQGLDLFFNNLQVNVILAAVVHTLLVQWI